MKLIFENVGRENWSGSIEIPANLHADDIAELAYKEVKKHLVSSEPDTEYNANTNKGKVYAGFHHVGDFHIDFQST